MSSFFEGRTVIKADALQGPRVYSTDLFPPLYDLSKPDESVSVTARALKIKIISKGLVTLNSAYSPMAVELIENHPDLLDGEAILPAFRTDKTGLADLIPSVYAPGAPQIEKKRLDDHVAKIEGMVTRVMPWELGVVGDLYRKTVLDGLRPSRR